MSITAGLSNVRRLSPVVGESVRFGLRYASRRPGLARYHVRETGMVIYLRHGTPDINTLEQIFLLGHYEPPAQVAGLLERLVPPFRVVDLGANIGLFDAWFLGRYPEASITAFEPDPSNADLLERSIRANGLADRWELRRAFAGVADGEVPFTVGEYTLGRVVDASRTKSRVAEVDVFPYLRDIDLLKIDIEGAEWAILTDPRFPDVTVPLIVLEYHAYRAPSPDPRRAAIDLLQGNGYTTADVEFEAEEGHGVLWAWRE